MNNDTAKLLTECNSGLKMGIASIDEALPAVRDPQVRTLLNNSKTEHEKLEKQTSQLLIQDDQDIKEPAPIAKGMSWLKTNVKLTLEKSDATVADLITDGCNMGVKTLNRYLNQYQTADMQAKNITEQLIGLESQLVMDLRPFL